MQALVTGAYRLVLSVAQDCEGTRREYFNDLFNGSQGIRTVVERIVGYNKIKGTAWKDIAEVFCVRKNRFVGWCDAMRRQNPVVATGEEIRSHHLDAESWMG